MAMSESKIRLKAATLAVGTEVTDGQILDRNSAWISQKLSRAGIQMIEHRAVADDREDITRALQELSARADLLFVTGGLGPTSDDFTRDLLATVFGRPLEYDETSWKQIEEKLANRGIVAREIQKQQCYFPRGSKILFNPAGTANAFSFEAKGKSSPLKVYALPGPPVEIAAVWDANLKSEIENLVPLEEREELFILRTLGRGESDIAEKTEAVIAGSGLRVGYRAHAPYVEVKLWYRLGEKAKVADVIRQLEKTLEPWIVNRNDEDAAQALLAFIRAGADLEILDAATFGVLHDRLAQQIREGGDGSVSHKLRVTTLFSDRASEDGSQAVSSKGAIFTLTCDDARNVWLLRLKSREGRESLLEESPPFKYKVRSDRGRKFITEKSLLWLTSLASELI
jgi:molybdenum cofactor synthesis domain-containing protein